LDNARGGLGNRPKDRDESTLAHRVVGVDERHAIPNRLAAAIEAREHPDVSDLDHLLQHSLSIRTAL
jgi:hypothetical protein